MNLKLHPSCSTLLILPVETVQERIKNVGNDSEDEPVYDDLVSYIEIPFTDSVVVCPHFGGIVVNVAFFEDTLDEARETGIENTSLELSNEMVVPEW